MAVATFRQNLPQLLKEAEGKWIAYHKAQQVGELGDSKKELIDRCRKAGIPENEFVVLCIREELPPATAHW